MCVTRFPVDPDEVKRDLGVLHPEVPGLGLAKEKQHAVIFLRWSRYISPTERFNGVSATSALSVIPDGV